MEFIEAKINPNSTLKNALKKVEKKPPKVKKKTRLKSPKMANRKKPRRTRHGPAWHGHARWHGQAVPLFWPAGRTGSWVHGPCAQFSPVSCLVSRLFSFVLLFLVLEASSILYSSLNLLLKSSFPSKPEDFSWNEDKSQFRHNMNRRKIIWP